jgi:hypothetical protein
MKRIFYKNKSEKKYLFGINFKIDALARCALADAIWVLTIFQQTLLLNVNHMFMIFHCQNIFEIPFSLRLEMLFLSENAISFLNFFFSSEHYHVVLSAL